MGDAGDARRTRGMGIFQGPKESYWIMTFFVARPFCIKRVMIFEQLLPKYVGHTK